MQKKTLFYSSIDKLIDSSDSIKCSFNIVFKEVELEISGSSAVIDFGSITK